MATNREKMGSIHEVDPKVASLIAEEEKRQYNKLRMIPSENYVSSAVLEATGSVLTNKYSEGYPGKRYYEGQEVIDIIEQLAIDRAKELFGVHAVNVQPYSGSPANLAVYMAVLNPGDTVLGMSLPHGGHLTHGWKVSITGKFFKAVQYTVDREQGLLDFDEIRSLALEHRPRLIIAGGTAYPRTIDFEAFASIAKEVDAVLLADIAHISGLIAGGAHPSPVGHANVISTTTHKTLRGPRGGMLMMDEEHEKMINRAVFPGLQGGPHNHTTAAIAVALKEASSESFSAYAHQIVANAKAMAERLSEHGFKLATGGTDNHLILMDTTPLGHPGKPVARALNAAGIVTNANSIPYDQRKPFDPSGVRLGTPAITSRGMKEREMVQIADWMLQAINNLDNEEALQSISAQVAEMCHAFPAPGICIGED
jgi:glycine hydroxymethyltransferase